MAMRAQRGQALVLGLVLLLAGAVALALLAGAGRATAVKHRLLNAVDAAALGAATWRARVLNFDAYANRAIVANEVAVAQAATLVSWSRYFEQLAANAQAVSVALPPASGFLAAVGQAASLSRQAAEQAAELEVSARAAAGIGYRDLLASSQELMHLTANTFALNTLATEIAQANDRAFFAHVLAGDTFGRFTRRYESDADRQRLRQVVQASLDAFTGGPRSLDLPYMIGGCLDSLDTDRLFNQIRKRGATVLSDDLDRWEAQDTASMHAWQRRGVLFGRCRESERVPLGWGAAAADATPERTLGGRAHDTARNPAARANAEAGLQALRAYGGLARVRELAYGDLGDDRYPVSRFAVLARVDAGAGAPAAGGAAPVRLAGRLGLPEAYANDRIWALAAAEVRFRRPQSAGGPVEFASLYSPYWQARLVEPTAAERTQADLHAR